MAEIAAGAVVAEQVVSTTIEGGAVAGYAIAKRTMPLKATLTRIAVSDLIRCHSHSISVANGKAYIFGGITPQGSLAGNDVHQITLPPKGKTEPVDYKCIPALPATDGSPVPSPRAGHSAAVSGNHIFVWGGRNEDGHSVEQGSQLWSFDTDALRWSAVAVIDGPRDCQFYHGSAISNDSLMLYGGFSRPAGTDDLRVLPNLSSVDVKTGSWQSHQDQNLSPMAVPSSIVAVGGQVFTVGGDSKFESPVHFYDIKTSAKVPKWDTISVPSNPLVPGPEVSRDGAGLLPISTGQGRHYLLYFFGQKGDTSSEHRVPPQSDEFFGDIWTFQLPSGNLTLASAKDFARDKLGMDSGYGSWAEVEVEPHAEEFAHEGKVHPGPRSFFAASNIDGTSVLLWGGLNPKQEVEGDGWIIRFE